MKKILFLVTVLMSVSALSACSNATKQKLGLAKQAPDEFMVMSRAPLSLPPEYDLRPVNVSAQPQEIDMTKRLAGMTVAEQKLMSKIEAENTDEDIKAKIDQEFKEMNENS